MFLITGRHEIADQDRAQGISGFFRKPFDAQALLAAIGDALRNREMEGDMRVDQPLLRRSAPLSPQGRGMTEQPLVIIVDDDASVREALSELILSAGFQPVCFASTRELLDADVLDSPGCLILDVRMPGASGLDLQHHLVRKRQPQADHLPDRAWRHSDDRPGDEGRRRGFSHQAGAGPDAA